MIFFLLNYPIVRDYTNLNAMGLIISMIIKLSFGYTTQQLPPQTPQPPQPPIQTPPQPPQTPQPPIQTPPQPPIQTPPQPPQPPIQSLGNTLSKLITSTTSLNNHRGNYYFNKPRTTDHLAPNSSSIIATPPVNRKMSPDVAPVCMCNNCGNKGLFKSALEASEYIGSTRDSCGTSYIVFPFGNTIVKIPSSTNAFRLGMLIHTIFKMNQKEIVHKYSSLGKFLNSLKKFRGSIRKLVIKIVFNYTDSVGITHYQAVLYVKLKHDHLNNLVLFFYSSDSEPSIVIPLQDMLHATNAVKLASYKHNSNWYIEWLKGSKSLGNSESPFFESKGYPPCFGLIMEYSAMSPNISTAVRKILEHMPTVLIDIILEYVATEVQVTGPLVDSSLRFLSGPLFEPNLLNLIAGFMHCPAKQSSLLDKYLK